MRLFVAVGIEPTRAKETCSNGALSTVFKDMIFKVKTRSLRLKEDPIEEPIEEKEEEEKEEEEKEKGRTLGRRSRSKT